MEMNAPPPQRRLRQRGLGPVHLPEQVDLQDAGELLGGGVLEPGDQQDPGHVHPRVQPAIGAYGTVGDGLNLSGVGDVGDDGGGRTALVLDLGDQRAQAGLTTGGHHDLRALLREAQGGGAADAAGGAHHDDDLLGDGFELHRRTSSRWGGRRGRHR